MRYVDDLLLFADDKTLLWEWKQQTEAYLAKLRLRFHSGTHPRPVTEGFGFLGFLVFPNQRRLKRRKGIQYQRRLKNLISQFERGEALKESLLDSIIAWNNHAGYGNTVGLRKALFDGLPDEIAAQARKRYQKILNRRDKTHRRTLCTTYKPQ